MPDIDRIKRETKAATIPINVALIFQEDGSISWALIDEPEMVEIDVEAAITFESAECWPDPSPWAAPETSVREVCGWDKAPDDFQRDGHWGPCTRDRNHNGPCAHPAVPAVPRLRAEMKGLEPDSILCDECDTYGGDESRAVFVEMLRGEATTEDYVAAVERDVAARRKEFPDQIHSFKEFQAIFGPPPIPPMPLPPTCTCRHPKPPKDWPSNEHDGWCPVYQAYDLARRQIDAMANARAEATKEFGPCSGPARWLWILRHPIRWARVRG